MFDLIETRSRRKSVVVAFAGSPFFFCSLPQAKQSDDESGHD